MHDPDLYQATHALIKRVNKTSADLRETAAKTRQVINDSREVLRATPEMGSRRKRINADRAETLR